MLDGYPAMCGLLANQGVLLGGVLTGKELQFFYGKEENKAKRSEDVSAIGQSPSSFRFSCLLPSPPAFHPEETSAPQYP